MTSTAPGQVKKIRGTITRVQPFDKAADVTKLQQLIAHPPCDTQLADFLTTRTNQQRQEIREAYKEATGKELLDDINAILSSGRYKEVVNGLLEDALTFAANCLYKAMKGIGTDEKALVDILCTRDRNMETIAIKETFSEIYGVDLEAMIKDETSDPFLTLLLTVAAGNRDETPSADIETQAKLDADALIKAGEGRTSGSRDDSKFTEILGTRSLIQLNLATFKYYDQKSKKGGILKALEAEGCADVIDGYLALVRTAKGELPVFFADRLYKSMKRLGTDDDSLIRTLIGRSEIDLATIKEEFKTKYGKTVEEFVQDDTSGEYCYILQRILTGGPASSAAAQKK